MFNFHTNRFWPIVLEKCSPKQLFVGTNSFRHCNSLKIFICYVFPGSFLGFNYRFSGTLRMKVFFQNFSDLFTEDKLHPFLISSEIDHPICLYFYQITYDIFCQLQIMHIMVLRAIPPILPTDDNIDELNSNHSFITETSTVKKIKTNFSHWLSISNPNNLCSFKTEYNNTAINEGIFTFEAIKILPTISSTPIQVFDIPLRIPTKATRKRLYSRNNPNVFGRSASRHNPFDTTSNRFHFETTALLLVWNLKNITWDFLF